MSTSIANIRIARATESDVPALRSLIGALAEHMKLADQVDVTEERLRETLFGEQPQAEVFLATDGTSAIGFAVFFPTYSTFVGRPGIYLEDLYVTPEWRSQGIGTALLAAVARTAIKRGCARLDWSVLNWNRRAVALYESLGAIPQGGSTAFRLSGEPLQRLAATESP